MLRIGFKSEAREIWKYLPRVAPFLQCHPLVFHTSRISNLCQQTMAPAKERRRHQRQQVLLPLRVMEKDPEGRLLFQGNTVNVGAGGVYFHTTNWREMPVGTSVHVVIDISPETFQLLPFGGLRGAGKVIRIDPTRSDKEVDPDPDHCGVAVRMTSRLRFDPELHLPRFETGEEASH